MKIPLFVELCAGLASVSGVLEHGSTWKPPVSRMGRKTGYASAILRVMGLRPRQRAERYLWAEADGDVAALLAAYTRPEVMREIAEIIRSWIPCPYGPHAPDPSCSRCKGTGRWDARDLWEVLRREERRGLWEGGGGAGEVAGWAWTLAVSCYRLGVVYDGEEQPRQFRDHAAWKSGAVVAMSPTGGRREELSAEFEPVCWPPVLIAQDAAVDVGSVAGWAHGIACAYDPCKMEKSGWRGGGFMDPDEDLRWRNREHLSSAFASCPVWPPVTLTPDAAIKPASVPPGTVVYMDPDYQGTTGYKHTFPRAQVCETAERWATAGARVYISEAEPIAALGWHHVEITSERKGQARTFGATPEWLTCSHRPAWTPPQQSTLFTRPT